MRVIPIGADGPVLVTAFRVPEMSDAEFAEELGLVEKDLQTLKTVLERGPRPG